MRTFVFPELEVRFERAGPRLLRGHHRVPAALLSDAFLQTIRGQLTAAPALIGAPEARVEMTRPSELEAEFEVELAPAGLAGRLGEAASQLFSRIRLRGQAIDAAARELESTRSQLLENLDELGRRAEELEQANARLRAEAAERERAEEAHRESEERYRQLFDGAADLIAVVGTDGELLELNARFEEEGRRRSSGRSIRRRSSRSCSTWSPTRATRCPTAAGSGSRRRPPAATASGWRR